MLPKHREFAQILNSLILKVKDNSKSVAKISKFFLKLDKSAKIVLFCNNHKSRKLAQGKFALGQGKKIRKTENSKMQF